MTARHSRPPADHRLTNPRRSPPARRAMAAAEPAAASLAGSQPDQDWEACKENFQPLKTGRKAAALRDSTADLRTQAIEARRRYVCRWVGVLERLLLLPAACRHSSAAGALAKSPSFPPAVTCRQFWEELSAYEGDDPLEVWLRCESRGE